MYESMYLCTYVRTYVRMYLFITLHIMCIYIYKHVQVESHACTGQEVGGLNKVPWERTLWWTVWWTSLCFQTILRRFLFLGCSSFQSKMPMSFARLNGKPFHVPKIQNTKHQAQNGVFHWIPFKHLQTNLQRLPSQRDQFHL